MGAWFGLVLVGYSFAGAARPVCGVVTELCFDLHRGILAAAQHLAGEHEAIGTDVGGTVAKAVGAAQPLLLVP